MQSDASGPGTQLIERLLLHWRVRCVLRRAPLEATSGPDAADLCQAVAAHLVPAWLAPPPALGRALRRWASDVVTPGAAQAALACLAEVVTELASEVSAEFPPTGLGPVLEAFAVEADGLAAVQAGVAVEAAPVEAAAPPSPWRDRRSLERDVEMAVALGAVEGRKSALAVVQVDGARRRSLRAPHRRPDEDADPVAPIAGILRLVLGTDALYRLGRDKLAVLVPGTDAKGVGALMLRVTCAAPRSRLSWGATSLGPGAGHLPGDGDALVMLAEADLVLRHRDLVHARRALTHYRQRVGASVAAAVLLLAGVVVGTASLRPGSPSAPTEALPVGGTVAPPSPVPGPSVPAAQPPPAPGTVTQTAPAPAPAPSPPSPPTGLQAQTVSAVVPAPAPVPPPPPAVPAPPPTPAKVHGSGKAPGTPGKPAGTTGHGKGPTV